MTDLTAARFKSETAARRHLERVRWPDGPICPHCGVVNEASRIKGKSARPGLWFCNACRTQFTVTVGTVFERSKIPLHKWLLAVHLMSASKKGYSSHQLHRTLGVTYKTAWFMSHRIREAMRDTNPTPMGGTGKTVEADETFIGPKTYKFNERKQRYQAQTGFATKYKVVALVERGGRARSIKVDNINYATIRAVLVSNVRRETNLMTDEARHYVRIGEEFSTHQTVNHEAGEYARGDVTTNTVEGFFGIFKRGMRGIYQHCGEQHLQRYLTEFDFRYNERIALGVDDAMRADKALKGIGGKRLTYRRTNETANA
jgi:transposase-like protein